LLCVDLEAKVLWQRLRCRYEYLAVPTVRTRDPSHPLRFGVGSKRRNVIDTTRRSLAQCRERDGCRDVDDVASAEAPSGYSLIENDRRSVVVHPLDVAKESMKRVVRPEDRG
jgi:hypothetical protein